MPRAMEEAASKGMGKVKAAKATIKGLKGIFKQLTEEHGEASVLLKRIEKTSDASVRAQLFPTLRMELLSHERGELTELYPLLEQRAETRSIATDHEDEAEEMESLLDELNTLGYDNPEWGETFERLVEAVEHHVSEEESEYFPKAQAVLGEDIAEDLLPKYLKMKKSVMGEMA